MRGRRYSADGEQNVASPTDSILGITGGTTVEPSVYFVALSSSGTPEDTSIQWFGGRHTAAGTATAVTPEPLGPTTTASTTTAGENHTVEPTYTAGAIVFRLALNQRATHSIHLDPDGALVVPASANNGITLYPVHASSTVLCDACVHFME